VLWLNVRYLIGEVLDLFVVLSDLLRLLILLLRQQNEGTFEVMKVCGHFLLLVLGW
jgi:hypothetical protein